MESVQCDVVKGLKGQLASHKPDKSKLAPIFREKIPLGLPPGKLIGFDELTWRVIWQGTSQVYFFLALSTTEWN
ncbi:hypothetical protein COLO4_25438 [Corchorus olitorius]|uniref:Uncharacterized protein n=1 Tax=Corchorus olitorius TaxID=93759 RepID=A0A1R3I2M8_9ROSI|nr:hypothetical protein COLO4_25438 [Corchorus olitorius]